MTYIYQTVTESMFHDAFVRMGRKDQFSHEGRAALYGYLAELVNDTGEPIKLDDWLADAEEQYLYAMRENYRTMLRKEAEYLQSAEYLEEGIRANEYEFDIDGNIA